jgi:hypothetical protein
VPGCFVVKVRARKHGKEITMEARLNYTDSAVAARFVKYLNSAGRAVADSGLPAATQHLVEDLYEPNGAWYHWPEATGTRPVAAAAMAGARR